MATDDRLALIADSYHRLTGKRLFAAAPDQTIDEGLWTAPRAILAHGAEADPVFFFGNAAALALFEMTFEQFTRLPSRLSAERVHRDERKRLLDRVTRHN